MKETLCGAVLCFWVFARIGSLAHYSFLYASPLSHCVPAIVDVFWYKK